MRQLFIFRHPVSIWNEIHRQQGQFPDEPGLSERGHAQAKKIAEFLSAVNINGIWTSPLPRAMALSEIIQRLHSSPISISPDDNLMEISHGGADGLFESEIKKIYPSSFKKMEKGSFEEDTPCFIGGETPLQVATRGANALGRILRSFADDICVVVSHGGVLSLTFAWIEGKSLRRAFSDPLKNGSLSIVTKKNNRIVILSKNKVDHLGETDFTPKIII